MCISSKYITSKCMETNSEMWWSVHLTIFIPILVVIIFSLEVELRTQNSDSKCFKYDSFLIHQWINLKHMLLDAYDNSFLRTLKQMQTEQSVTKTTAHKKCYIPGTILENTVAINCKHMQAALHKN